MRTLVVGGTGMIGSHVVQHLRDLGHETAVLARRPPAEDLPAAAGQVVLGDYTDPDLEAGLLRGFDAVVFAAGNDVRHLRPTDDPAEFWRRTQTEGVPGFLALARSAGLRRAVQIGSYYHQVRPDLRASVAYVEARALADERARALDEDGFGVCTLNPPSIVGELPGRTSRWYGRLARWAHDSDGPDFAPPGGTNYLAVASLAEAVAGALVNGEGGRAYLVGDENLSHQALFHAVFRAVGSDKELVVRDQEHPYLPDAAIVHGRGETIAFAPDPAEQALLGYRTGVAAAAAGELARAAYGG